jgi:hypothetical protein
MDGREIEALAQTAAQTLVAAATTDVWSRAKLLFAKLIGRDDPVRIKTVERRLEETRSRLADAPRQELAAARTAQEGAWVTRVLDFLDANPDAEEEIQQFIISIAAELKEDQTSASNRGISAGRDIKIFNKGGVVAGVIGGDVSLPGESGH